MELPRPPAGGESRDLLIAFGGGQGGSVDDAINPAKRSFRFGLGIAHLLHISDIGTAGEDAATALLDFGDMS